MSQICLYEFWRRVDTDLPEDTATRINKAMRRVRRDDDDAAGGYLARLLADGHCAGTLQREFYLDVRVYVQRWTLTWFGINKIGGEWCALFFAVELILTFQQTAIAQDSKSSSEGISLKKTSKQE